MGELIMALLLGGWLVFMGVFLNVYLSREEKREVSRHQDHKTEKH